MEQGALIGVDLGGTKVVAGLVINNKPVKSSYQLIAAKSNDPQVVINELISVIEELFNNDVMAIGVGIPGLVDRSEGIVNDVQNIPAWKEIRLKQILEDYFNVPVYLDNAANCFALGKAR